MTDSQIVDWVNQTKLQVSQQVLDELGLIAKAKKNSPSYTGTLSTKEQGEIVNKYFKNSIVVEENNLFYSYLVQKLKEHFLKEPKLYVVKKYGGVAPNNSGIPSKDYQTTLINFLERCSMHQIKYQKETKNWSLTETYLKWYSCLYFDLKFHVLEDGKETLYMLKSKNKELQIVVEHIHQINGSKEQKKINLARANKFLVHLQNTLVFKGFQQLMKEQETKKQLFDEENNLL